MTTTTIEDDVRLRNTKQAAQVLNCSEWEVRQLVKSGELGAYRLGRGEQRRLKFSDAQLAAYLTKIEVGPAVAQQGAQPQAA
jgi:excisionase family DNA binding protein